jgi:hypothetical protein
VNFGKYLVLIRTVQSINGELETFLQVTPVTVMKCRTMLWGAIKNKKCIRMSAGQTAGKFPLRTERRILKDKIKGISISEVDGSGSRSYHVTDVAINRVGSTATTIVTLALLTLNYLITFSGIHSKHLSSHLFHIISYSHVSQ